jgi:hypothetical protein
MVSWETRIPRSSGYARASQPAICSGDQRSSSRDVTSSRNRGWQASLLGFGRRARVRVSASAQAAW